MMSLPKACFLTCAFFFGLLIPFVSVYPSAKDILNATAAAARQEDDTTSPPNQQQPQQESGHAILSLLLPGFDFISCLGLLISFTWIQYRKDCPLRRKSIFHGYMSIIFGLAVGNILLASTLLPRVLGAMSMSASPSSSSTTITNSTTYFPLRDVVFPAVFSLTLCGVLIWTNDWEDDTANPKVKNEDDINDDDDDDNEEDVKRPLIQQ